MTDSGDFKRRIEKRIQSYEIEIANCSYLERTRFTQERMARIEELSVVLEWLKDNEKENKPEMV